MPAAVIEAVISGRPRDLGGFAVRRVLPWAKRRMVGPFIFFDALGPEVLAPGAGIDVRPHPHIGLSTVTYLFVGELLHRDSLGNVQPIRPGEVNWMTAGRGIVHSERTPPEVRARENTLFGIQVWVAHPRGNEEIAPAFRHHARETLPTFERAGVSGRLILGAFEGLRSPVHTLSPTLYAEFDMKPGARLVLTTEAEERAVFVVAGALLGGAGTRYAPGSMVVLGRGNFELTAAPERRAKVMLIGGARLDGERYIEWNFVSSSRERIAQAKADWAAGRFARIPGETEFIPLPRAALQDVAYP